MEVAKFLLIAALVGSFYAARTFASTYGTIESGCKQYYRNDSSDLFVEVNGSLFRGNGACKHAYLYRPVTGTTQIRLVGGGTLNEGRVEVFHDGEWGTVCDDEWDEKDARVVCRMLGYGDAVSALSEAHFGRGEGRIWLDDVECEGDEEDIKDCPRKDWGSHYCYHYEDASVVCSNQASGTLRLIGEIPSPFGRVEIKHGENWGTICDDGWDIKDAQVVCRQLGFSGALAAPGRARFGAGVSKILLSGVQCNGTETDLTHCPHNGWETNHCKHSEDASVVCYNGAYPTKSCGRRDCSGRCKYTHAGGKQAVECYFGSCVETLTATSSRIADVCFTEETSATSTSQAESTSQHDAASFTTASATSEETYGTTATYGTETPTPLDGGKASAATGQNTVYWIIAILVALLVGVLIGAFAAKWRKRVWTRQGEHESTTENTYELEPYAIPEGHRQDTSPGDDEAVYELGDETHPPDGAVHNVQANGPPPDDNIAYGMTDNVLYGMS